MEKELIKRAVNEAEESLKEKQVSEIKAIVLKTLEKINKLDKEIDNTKSDLKELEEQKKILRMDLDDMKEGRLDRIAERQEKDPEARKVSVVLIIKEKEVIHEHHYHDYWHYPYTVVWQNPYVPVYNSPTILCQGSSGTYNIQNGTTTDGLNYTMETYTSPTINASLTKFYTSGTYDVNGNVINLR